MGQQEARNRTHQRQVRPSGSVESAGHALWPGWRQPAAVRSAPALGRAVSVAGRGVAPETLVPEFAMRDEVSRKRVRDVHESILLLASVSVQFCDYSGITVQSATA